MSKSLWRRYVTPWLTRGDQSSRPVGKRTSRSRARSRPTVEALEDRQLLAAGFLDPTFAGGAILLDFSVGGNSDDRATAVAVDSQNRVVVAGFVQFSATDYNFVVARFNPNGTPDTTFSGDGLIALSFGGLDERATSVAIDSLDRIVVAGFTQVGTTADYNFGVFRLNTNGTFDATFNGGGATFGFTGNLDERATSVAVDSQNRVVVAGYTQNGATADHDFAVFRLTNTGGFDASFNGVGAQIIAFDQGGNLDDRANAVAVDSLDRIVLAGYAQFSAAGDHDFAVIRLNTNGSFDGTFGLGGTQLIPFDLGGNLDDRANAVAIDGQGRIVVAGYAQFDATGDHDFAIARLTSGGAPDTTFSTDGQTTVFFDLGPNFDDRATGVAVDSTGRIVMVGFAQFATTGDYDIAVARLNDNGDLDASFNGGRTFLNIDQGPNFDDRATAVDIDSNGRILVAGFSQFNVAGDYDWVVLGLQADKLQLSAATYTVSESAGNATVTLTRTGGTTGALTVMLATSEGSATAGLDYTAVTQIVSFAANQTTATVVIPIINDMLVEPAETINLTLSGVTGFATLGAPISAILTITDDDVASAAVRVQGVVLNDGLAQRSQVRSLTVTFTGLATFTGSPAAAFRLRDGNGNLLNVQLTAAVSTDTQGRTVVRLTFAGPGTVGGSLVDGSYQLQVDDAGIANFDGDGDGTAEPNDDFIFGDQPSELFFRRYGDLDGNGRFDGIVFIDRLGSPHTEYGGELGALLDALLTPADYNAFLDTNGDALVNGLDLEGTIFHADSVETVLV